MIEADLKCFASKLANLSILLLLLEENYSILFKDKKSNQSHWIEEIAAKKLRSMIYNLFMNKKQEGEEKMK